jgi:hypothetical protein
MRHPGSAAHSFLTEPPGRAARRIRTSCARNRGVGFKSVLTTGDAVPKVGGGGSHRVFPQKQRTALPDDGTASATAGVSSFVRLPIAA